MRNIFLFNRYAMREYKLELSQTKHRRTSFYVNSFRMMSIYIVKEIEREGSTNQMGLYCAIIILLRAMGM